MVYFIDITNIKPIAVMHVLYFKCMKKIIM